MRSGQSNFSKLFVFIIVIVCAAVIVCCMFFIAPTSVSFQVDSIEMKIGESLDIDDDIVEILPFYASDNGYTISSSDEEIFSCGVAKTITAVGAGTAELTVTSTFDTSDPIYGSISVTVTYDEIKQIEVIADNRTEQYTDDLSQINFSLNVNGADASDGAYDINATVDWYVDGELAAEGKSIDAAFVYEPEDESREYIITAKCDVDDEVIVEDSQSVKIYIRSDYTPVLVYDSDDLIQDEGEYKSVTFTLDYEYDTSSLAPTIVWMNNDQVVEALDDGFTYIFTPSGAGAYEICLWLNGELVEDAYSTDTIVVIARGSVEIEKLSFNFDDFYPNLIVSWGESGFGDLAKYEIKISKVVSYSSKDTVIVEDLVVSGSTIDVTSYIGESCNYNIFNSTFEISVKGADSEYTTETDYCDPITIEQLSTTAKMYLKLTYYDGAQNYYAESVEELADIFEYTRLFRSNLTSTSTETFKAYLGFDGYTSNNYAAIDEAFSMKNATGEYGLQYLITTDNVLSMMIEYYTANLPSTSTTGSAKYPAADTYRPNVNYDADNTRGDNYEFAIESCDYDVSVSTSEQLFTVAQEGYNPVPTAGSNAETIYNQAKEVLINIIPYDKDDDDFYKINAIYDYVLWRVSYDYDVLDYSSISEAVTYTSYYLDGAFDFERSFAVCDGISKMFSLLCNIEGINCVRVIGDVNSAGHAWNKVLYDGNWYIVDCTWGDATVSLPTAVKKAHYESTSSAGYEVGNHYYLFKTDSEMSSHVEDGSYPATTTEPFNYYDEYEVAYENTMIDFYLDDKTTVYDETKKLVEYMLSMRPGSEDFYVGGADSELNKSTSSYYSYDFMVDASCASYFTSFLITSPIKQAMENANIKSSEYSILTETVGGDTMIYLFIKV